MELPPNNLIINRKAELRNLNIVIGKNIMAITKRKYHIKIFSFGYFIIFFVSILNAGMPFEGALLGGGLGRVGI